MTLPRTRDHLRRAIRRLQHLDDTFEDQIDAIVADPSAYYRAGLRDLLSAAILHLLHQAGNAGLTVEAVRNSIRCEHAAAFDAFQRLHKAGLVTDPQRQGGRGRPYAWTILPAGSAVVTTPPLRALTVQPILLA